eukprot:scaffold33757_cov55-Prasinocladus_malaysianus.AAC.1
MNGIVSSAIQSCDLKLLGSSSDSGAACGGSLRPTRVPYEESSVYSELSAKKVDGHPEALEVILQPGEVLFVPRHWWHQ